MRVYRHSISAELVYLQKVEATIFILQKVAHKVVESAFSLRDIHLGKDLVDGVYSFDCCWMRVGHHFCGKSIIILLLLASFQFVHVHSK